MANKLIYIIVPVLLLLSFAVAEAAVPRQVSLSGVRTNSSGGAEIGATHLNVNFTIFGLQSGGRMLDTREINITTNANGFWFTNYSTSGFDTEIDLWLAINNTAPRIFLGTDAYSGQYVKRNESNVFNSSNTFVRGQTWLAGQQFAHLNVSGDVNITAISDNDHVFAIFSSTGVRQLAVDLGNSIVGIAASLNVTTSGTSNAFIVKRTDGPTVLRVDTTGPGMIHALSTLNITNLTAGTSPFATLLINNTGGINASAVGFGTIPLGVFGNLFSTANTWTTTQTVNTTGAAPIQWSSNIVGANALGILAFSTGSAADPTTIIYAGTDNRLAIGANARTTDLILDRSGNFTITGGNLSLTNALIHVTSGSLINMTGGINASAVGFGLLPNGVIPIGNNTGAGAGGAITSDAQGGARIYFGYMGFFQSNWGLINLSTGYTCTDCYYVQATTMNGSGTGTATYEVKRMNSSQFNISSSVAGANVSWMAVGF